MASIFWLPEFGSVWPVTLMQVCHHFQKRDILSHPSKCIKIAKRGEGVRRG